MRRLALYNPFGLAGRTRRQFPPEFRPIPLVGAQPPRHASPSDSLFWSLLVNLVILGFYSMHFRILGYHCGDATRSQLSDTCGKVQARSPERLYWELHRRAYTWYAFAWPLEFGRPSFDHWRFAGEHWVRTAAITFRTILMFTMWYGYDNCAGPSN